MLDTAPSKPDTQPPGRHRRRAAHQGLRFGIVFLLVAGMLAAAGVRYYSYCQGASGPKTPVAFTVAEGSSGGEVVDALHDAGVIRCGLVSKGLLRTSGKQDEIRAGEYQLTTNMTPDAAFAALSAPPLAVPTLRLTIPEGYRITQIAERVRESLGIPVKKFLAAAGATNWSLPPYLPKDASSPEGFLFPQTYQFVKGDTTADEVIKRLLDEFRTEAASLPWGNADALGVTPYEVVVIASMIEEEARVPGDRPKIAAVIYNRLAQGMNLGIDATLQYVDPNPADGLTVSDFQIDSPYNTRLSPGLPPTPIASPGIASLDAALNPADITYLYYVLCGADGHHKFSDTFAQFEQDVSTCLG